ncbi:UNVERIFIED_CONTAM: hypothetical protein PYX00_000977 [Menopon gallinae]
MWTLVGCHALKKGTCLRASLNWRPIGNIGHTPKKLIITSKLYSLPRNLTKTLNQSFIVCAKVGFGIGCGLTWNCYKVHCEHSTSGRVVTVEKSEEFPEFNWYKCFQLLKPYLVELIAAICAALGCALLNILIPGALGSLIDVINQTSTQNSYWDDLKKPASHLLFYSVLHSVLTYCHISLLSHIAEGLAKTLKVKLFATILSQDIAFFDKHRTGELLSRLTVDVHDFKSSFKIVISQGFRNVAQIVGCSITLLRISPHLSAVMILVVPTIIMLGSLFGSMLRKVSLRAKAQTATVTLAAEEAISNIRTVRAFAMEETENKMLKAEVEKAASLEIRLGQGIGVFQAGTNLFLNGMVLSTMYMGGHLLRSGMISAGDLMAFLVAVQMLQRSFSHISLLFGTYIKGLHAGARVFSMLDLPPGKSLDTGKIIPYHSLIPDVELKNVTFAYPSRPDHVVLNDVSVKIPANTTVAFVGPSGSGKTTIACLIERMYDAENGVVEIGGQDVTTLNAAWLRGKVIGFISQEPLLFATSIMENIRYGRPEATDAEVIQAAKVANADNFINMFPRGYQTKVGERGVALSGGQRQRIAIARAVLKNPSILILDEATSALDAESESAVQKALETVTKSKTTIVIAHRLSTIIKADIIVVLSGGKIVEMGSHKELMEKKGLYASLVAQQMS